MDNTVQTLLDILKITYFNKEIDVTIDDPNKIYQIAKENGLSGTIYNTIKEKISDETILNKFKKDFFKYISDDIRKFALIHFLSEKLNQNEIDYIFLKGSNLKYLYSETYMRSMGDIDVLVRESDESFIERILLASGFKLSGRGPVHDTYSYGDLVVEIHRCLIIDQAHFNLDSIQDVWLSANHVKDKQYSMSCELELLFLIIHIKKHLLSDGVGLRSILDIGIYLNHYKNKMNLEKLNKLLIEANSITLYSNLLLFNQLYLGLELSNHYKVNTEFDYLLYETFTEYIIRSGVHGLGFNFNVFASRFAGYENNNLTRSRSLLSILFPSLFKMKYKYPKMMKYNFMLPLSWIRRGFSVLFKHPRKILVYCRLINRVDKKEVENISQLYKKLGI